MSKIVVTGPREAILKRVFTLDKETIYDVQIEPHRAKRSLNANNYCWHLINEIANAIVWSKLDVYLKMLKDYGVVEVAILRKDVDPSKYFKYYDKLDESKDYVRYRIYLGSSKMNTSEMSHLIDGIVQEAENLGIETMKPEQLALLKSEWESE